MEFSALVWTRWNHADAFKPVFGNDENGYEHVSVDMKERDPTWGEMCQVKDTFWHDEEECYEIHPRKSEYINMRQHCLHIWRHKIGKNPGFVRAVREALDMIAKQRAKEQEAET